MAEQNLNKLIVIAAAAILAFFIIRPYFTAIVFAAVVAFLLYPAHQKLAKKVSETASLYILTLIAAAVTLLLMFYGASIVLSELSKAYLFISKSTLQLANIEFSDTLKNAARFLFQKTIESLSGSITSIPKVILSFFVFFISLFYFLKDGKEIANWAMAATPLANDKKEAIADDIKRYTYAFVYVWSLIAILQGIVAVTGFYIFGLSYGLLAGIAAAVLSFLPIIGPYSLYVPVGLILILSGNVNAGAGIMAYGLIIGSILDYVLRPYLAGRQSKSHPLLILLGILGGLSLIGPAGIIVGPVILLGATAILKGVNLSSFK